MVTKAQAGNALKLSAWLAVHEPQLFRRILVGMQKLQRTPMGRLGFFGDDAALDTVTVTAGDVTPVDFANVDSSFIPDVSLSDVNFDVGSIGITPDAQSAIAAAVSGPADGTLPDATQSSAGFWSAIGAGISGVAGAVGKVAGALTSPQAISAASNAATAYFNAQARTAQTQAQNATVQMQLARLSQGAAPAPVSYVRDPVTGAVTPVYASNAGPQPLTPSLISRLSSPGGLSSTTLIGGGIAIAIILALLASK